MDQNDSVHWQTYQFRKRVVNYSFGILIKK